MQEAVVYTIIVTYNGMQWISKCLGSLASGSISTHIIVVDNGSSDGTVPFIKNNYPFVQMIETASNLGFGQGNNIGLQIAYENNADHIFLLNQDAWVQHDTIEKLVKAQKENPIYGIVSPMHLNGAGNNFDDHFYDYLIRSDIRHLILSEVVENHNSSSLINTLFVNAAAWLISKECLQKTGGFDPIFFHYGEDDNYANRVLYKGFKIGILLNTFINHDKERPIKANVGKALEAKVDWLNLLNTACDVRRPGYVMLLFKRFLRHSFFAAVSFFTFNKTQFLYHFFMVKKIATSLFAIQKSRTISAAKSLAHLKIVQKANLPEPTFEKSEML